MFRKTALALAGTAALLASPVFAQSSPVVGSWKTQIDVQGSVIESTLTVAQSGSGYTVEIKDGPMPGAPADAPPMPSTISDVKVDGATITFNRQLTTPQGDMALAYKGTATGNDFAGEINSDFGAIPLTGKRL